MKRDLEIQRIFEIADDSLIAVLGYHFYVISMEENINDNAIWTCLPDGVISHTFSWDRFYHKKDLIDQMSSIFEFYQSRISMIAMVNVFEASLSDFISALNKKGKVQNFESNKLSGNSTYKKRLKWAYRESIQCDIGDLNAIQRLPKTFGIIDNARRIRNLIVHNHGIFEDRYKEDAIKIDNISVNIHPDFSKHESNTNIKIPVIITTEDIKNFSRSHIEVLHILHNTIQKKYFNFLTPYDYRDCNKSIEWHRVLWGI